VKCDRVQTMSVNVSSASVKNKVAVAVNRVVVKQADDKSYSFEPTKRREVIPTALLRPGTSSVSGYCVISLRYRVQPFCGALPPTCPKA
jgi:hypothetical protein